MAKPRKRIQKKPSEEQTFIPDPNLLKGIKDRRHHNNKGSRHTQNDKCARDVECMAQRVTKKQK